MTAGTISLFGMRRADTGRPSAETQRYRRADSVATASANVKKPVHAIKPLLTDADPVGVEQFAAYCAADEIPRLIHRRKGWWRQGHSRARAMRMHRSIAGDTGMEKR
jgi:hypothetical protein